MNNQGVITLIPGRQWAANTAQLYGW